MAARNDHWHLAVPGYPDRAQEGIRFGRDTAHGGGGMNGRRRCDSLAALIHTLSRRLNAASAQEGLSPAQASVLAVVADRVTVGLGELSEIEGLNPTALSRLVGRLETFGLVRQLCHPADHRAALVEVTRAGEKTWQLIAAERGELIS